MLISEISDDKKFYCWIFFKPIKIKNNMLYYVILNIKIFQQKLLLISIIDQTFWHFLNMSWPDKDNQNIDLGLSSVHIKFSRGSETLRTFKVPKWRNSQFIYGYVNKIERKFTVE